MDLDSVRIAGHYTTSHHFLLRLFKAHYGSRQLSSEYMRPRKVHTYRHTHTTYVSHSVLFVGHRRLSGAKGK